GELITLSRDHSNGLDVVANADVRLPNQVLWDIKVHRVPVAAQRDSIEDGSASVSHMSQSTAYRYQLSSRLHTALRSSNYLPIDLVQRTGSKIIKPHSSRCVFTHTRDIPSYRLR